MLALRKLLHQGVGSLWLTVVTHFRNLRQRANLPSTTISAVSTRTFPGRRRRHKKQNSALFPFAPKGFSQPIPTRAIHYPWSRAIEESHITTILVCLLFRQQRHQIQSITRIYSSMYIYQDDTWRRKGVLLLRPNVFSWKWNGSIGKAYCSVPV